MIEFLPLVAGIGLTLLAILAARQRISAVEEEIRKRNAPTEIVVAAGPIPAGEAFAIENLAKKPIPAEAASRRHVPASDFELLLDARAKVEIPKGEPVLWTDVEEPVEVEQFSPTIPKGRRAITVDADTGASFSGLLRPGDRVDILWKGRDRKAFGLLLSDVSVIAVNRRFLPYFSEEEENAIQTVTLSVTADEAVRLSAAAREGHLSWLLRNPDDRGRSAIGKVLQAKSPPPVEIWKAGIRERKPPELLGAGDL